jgi:hypothetical protein
LTRESFIVAPPEIKNVGADTDMLASNDKRPTLPYTIKKRLHNLRRFLGWSSAVWAQWRPPYGVMLGRLLEREHARFLAIEKVEKARRIRNH